MYRISIYRLHLVKKQRNQNNITESSVIPGRRRSSLFPNASITVVSVSVYTIIIYPLCVVPLRLHSALKRMKIKNKTFILNTTCSYTCIPPNGFRCMCVFFLSSWYEIFHISYNNIYYTYIIIIYALSLIHYYDSIGIYCYCYSSISLRRIYEYCLDLVACRCLAAQAHAV